MAAARGGGLRRLPAAAHNAAVDALDSHRYIIRAARRQHPPAARRKARARARAVATASVQRDTGRAATRATAAGCAKQHLGWTAAAARRRRHAARRAPSPTAAREDFAASGCRPPPLQLQPRRRGADRPDGPLLRFGQSSFITENVKQRVSTAYNARAGVGTRCTSSAPVPAPLSRSVGGRSSVRGRRAPPEGERGVPRRGASRSFAPCPPSNASQRARCASVADSDKPGATGRRRRTTPS